MRTVIICFGLLLSLHVKSQDCVCDTILNKVIVENTSTADSVNWKELRCYYLIKGKKKEVKSSVRYLNGKRHGFYFVNYPPKFALVVPPNSSSYVKPIPYNRRRDFWRRNDKSIYRRKLRGYYQAGLKNKEWVQFDTNQRILSIERWDQGSKISGQDNCDGFDRVMNFKMKSSLAEIEAALQRNESKFSITDDQGFTGVFNAQRGQLHGEITVYDKRNKTSAATRYSFENHCRMDSTIHFSINGDTTRIETDFKNGIPYTIVSYTPSSRGTTFYRDPEYAWELESYYQFGLVVIRREKIERER